MAAARAGMASTRRASRSARPEVVKPLWFSRLGLPLAPQERATIAEMLGALDHAPETSIVIATGWSDVAKVLRGQEWDSRWWDLEEQERERLWSAAGDQMLEAVLLERLAALSSAHELPILDGAAQVASRDSVSDAGLIRAAAEAAALAAHQCALSTLAAAPAEHYFQHKFELFLAGRWPLGVVEGSFLIF